MPRTEVYFYRDDDGSVPVLDWMLALRDKRATKKCFGLVKLLKDLGSEIRRPRADYLRDGVHELRTEAGNVNYRILYGFVGKDVALLACGLTKEREVPDREIDRAVERVERYNNDPSKHRFIYDEESQNG